MTAEQKPDGAALEHPIQPHVTDAHGVVRFKENAIVRFLSQGRLNDIATMWFSAEDQQQLAQLIGYSISGYGDLPYVTDEAYERAAAVSAPQEPYCWLYRDHNLLDRPLKVAQTDPPPEYAFPVYRKPVAAPQEPQEPSTDAFGYVDFSIATSNERARVEPKPREPLRAPPEKAAEGVPVALPDSFAAGPVGIVAVDGVGQISVGWIKRPRHNDRLYAQAPAVAQPVAPSYPRSVRIKPDRFEIGMTDGTRVTLWRPQDEEAPPQPPAQPAEEQGAARDVLAERKRQIEHEGWTAEASHDPYTD